MSCRCNGSPGSAKLNGEILEISLDGEPSAFVYPLANSFCETLSAGTLHVATNTRDWQLVGKEDEMKRWASLFATASEELEKKALDEKRESEKKGKKGFDRKKTIVIRNNKGRKRTYLTLEDSVISYNSVDKFGNPIEAEKRIDLGTIRAVQIIGTFLRILTMDNVVELETDSTDSAAEWSKLVNTALEEWSTREMEEAGRASKAEMDSPSSKELNLVAAHAYRG